MIIFFPFCTGFRWFFICVFKDQSEKNGTKRLKYWIASLHNARDMIPLNENRDDDDVFFYRDGMRRSICYCYTKEAHQLTTMLTFRGWHSIRHPHTPSSMVSFSLLPGPVNTIHSKYTRTYSALGVIDLIHFCPSKSLKLDTYANSINATFAVLLLVAPETAALESAPKCSLAPHAHTHTNYSVPAE